MATFAATKSIPSIVSLADHFDFGKLEQSLRGAKQNDRMWSSAIMTFIR
jgi:hypothetical protein